MSLKSEVRLEQADRSGKTALQTLSVIIPSYQNEAQLARCLNSVAAQSCGLAVLETIVCDSSPRFDVRAWKSRFPEVEFFHFSTRLFAGTARNRGATHAKCNWLCFLDADCIWNSGWLTRALKQISDFKEGGAFNGPVLFEDSKNSTATAFHIFEFHEFLSSLVWTPRFAHSGNLLISKSLFLESGGFREDIPMCTDFTFSIDSRFLRFDPHLSITHLSHHLSREELKLKSFNMGFWRGRIDSQVKPRLQLQKKKWLMLAPPLVLGAIFWAKILERSVRLRSIYRRKAFVLSREVFAFCLRWAFGFKKGLSESL